MPNLQASIKQVRKIKSKTFINKRKKSRFKSILKKANKLVVEKDKEKGKKFLPELNSELNKLSKTGVIKKGTIRRHISRITKKINSL